MYKFIFYVPENRAEEVKDAVFKTGAGSIGNYKNCAFETLGTGQFLPGEGASPAIGSLLKLEKVRELKVEVLCLEEQVESALKAMLKAHPYEEPAWEVLKMENERFLKKVQD